MCGIVGIWNKGSHQSIDRSVIEGMASRLAHRGPDDLGAWGEGDVGLGHSRLAVIDVTSGGHQPMTTLDGRYTITYNGELYNYRELARKYLSDIDLQTGSDTEVLLHLLSKQGDEIIGELRGMFALGLWDSDRRELLLARGPFGKKPLYYIELPEVFLFASEVKALFKDKRVRREIDPTVLGQYLLHEYVPAPLTGWQGIKELPMGSTMRVTEDGSVIDQWWKPSFSPKYTGIDANSKFDSLLEVAVRRRMVADVPVGVLLSGGLDSTAIAWYMRQHTSSLHSFSVSFDEESYNEGGFALRAAAALGTEHHDIKFGLEEFTSTLAETIELMDIPFADASLLPTYAVSRLAKKYVTVALDGDGSDELLMGYGTFQAAELADRLDWVPNIIWENMRRLANLWPTNHDYFSTDFKLKQFLKGVGSEAARRQQIWLGSFSDSEMAPLLTNQSKTELVDTFDAVDSLNGTGQNLTQTDELTNLLLQHYLHNAILVKLDRASMMVGLEARTPFLDVDLAEFAMKLPSDLKRHKKILKDVMRKRIPDEIIDRPKHGFAMPIGQWLRGPLQSWARDVLDEDKIRDDNVFVFEEVERLMNEHRDGVLDHRKKLWTILMWQIWYDRWVVQRDVILRG